MQNEIYLTGDETELQKTGILKYEFFDVWFNLTLHGFNPILRGVKSHLE